MLTRANRGMVINIKSSYCKDRANQGRVNQGIAVLFKIALVFVPGTSSCNQILKRTYYVHIC